MSNAPLQRSQHFNPANTCRQHWREKRCDPLQAPSTTITADPTLHEFMMAERWRTITADTREYMEGRTLHNWVVSTMMEHNPWHDATTLPTPSVVPTNTVTESTPETTEKVKYSDASCIPPSLRSSWNEAQSEWNTQLRHQQKHIKRQTANKEDRQSTRRDIMVRTPWSKTE